MTSLILCHRCADEVLSEEQRIDILILNAGVMVPPTGARTEDDFEMQIGTNHLGHFLLARLLMPLVKKTAKESQAARIVVVSSLAHVNSGGPIMLDNFAYKDCKPFRAYSQSKVPAGPSLFEIIMIIFSSSPTSSSLGSSAKS